MALKELRVIIAGSRNYNNYENIFIFNLKQKI